MYAYVYLPVFKRYAILKNSDIVNFEYERIGHQSKTFAAKPFQCKISCKDKLQVCQILIVGADEDELEQFTIERRPHVPKLNNSDLNINESNLSSLNEQVSSNRKTNNAKQNKSFVETSESIIKSHLKSSCLKAKESSNSEGLRDKSNNKRHNENKNMDLESTVGADNEEDEQSEHEDNEENVPNNNIYQLQRELALYKDKYNNVNKQKHEAVQANKLLQNKLAQYRKRVQDMQSENDEVLPGNAEQKKKGFPKCLKTNRGVTAKSEAVETAYSQTEPSKFYAHMCYAVWGHKALSERCVKKTKRTKDLKILTPKKKKVVPKHFEHFLQHYDYPEPLYNLYMRSMNVFAHRAITNAKKHMHLVEKYPELNSDNEEFEDEMKEI